LALFVPAEATAGRTHLVQPGDRLHGRWVTEMESLREYLSSVLQPVKANCHNVTGPMTYAFVAKGDPRMFTMAVSTSSTQVLLNRQRSGGRWDTIAFEMNFSHVIPMTLTAGNIIELTNTAVATTVDGYTVNDVFLGSMELSVTPAGMAWSASRMRYDFLDDNTVRMTPIFPPAPDGVSIHPRPFILKRVSSNPD